MSSISSISSFLSVIYLEHVTPTDLLIFATFFCFVSQNWVSKIIRCTCIWVLLLGTYFIEIYCCNLSETMHKCMQMANHVSWKFSKTCTQIWCSNFILLYFWNWSLLFVWYTTQMQVLKKRQLLKVKNLIYCILNVNFIF